MTDEKREPTPRLGWLELSLVAAVVVLAAQLAWPAWQMWQNRPRPGVQVVRWFGSTGYLLCLPREYDRQPIWPLLVYLHGGARRGTDPAWIADGCGPPALIKRGRQFPMIVVAPQCRPGEQFDPDEVLALVDHIVEEFHVDATRIYAAGDSLGGRGTWDVALADPGRFAAIAPVCGVADASRAETLKGVAVWAFHGASDEVMPIRCTQAMIERLQAAGGHATLTVYHEHGHDIGGLTYGNDELYTWLLSQRRVK